MSEKLEALRRKKAEAEAKNKFDDEAREVEELEVELATAERHGRRGARWELISTTEGPVVVVRGDGLHFKKFSTALQDEAKTAPEVMIAARAFVLDQVAHPDREKAEALFNAAPGLVVRCQDVLVALHRGEETSRAGKR